MMQVAQARAQNQAMMDQYKYRLQIRDKRTKITQQIYATKLGQYDLQMTAADRAASRAYGIEQYKQSQRLKQAAFQGMRLDRALAKSGGRAAAAGKSGRSAQRLDTNVENAFVRNQNMIAQNLLTAEERHVNSVSLVFKIDFKSARNRAYSQVAIAPTKPSTLLEPTQLSGPSTAGRNLGILNAGIGMALAAGIAPSVGDPTGKRYQNIGNYGPSTIATVPLWKSQKFNTNLVRFRRLSTPVEQVDVVQGLRENQQRTAQ